jgi:hypothetical protein
MEWHNCNNLENKTNYSIKTVLVHYVILLIIIDFQLVNSLKYWKHGISNLLPIVYRTLYPWYIEPPSYGVSNSLPMVYWTSFLWHYEPALLVKMRVFNLPWWGSKYHDGNLNVGSKYHMVYFTRGWFFRDSKYHVTPVSLTLPLTFWIISNLQIRLRLNVLVNFVSVLEYS